MTPPKSLTQFLNTLLNVVKYMEQGSSQPIVKKRQQKHVLKMVKDKGLWNEIKPILFGNKVYDAIRTLKEKYSIEITGKTVWSWKKFALKEMETDAAAKVTDEENAKIISSRNKLREILLNKDTNTDLIKRKIALLDFQERRIAIDFKLEQQMNKLIPSTDNSVKIYLEILDSLAFDMRSLGIMPTVASPENRELNELDCLVAILRKRIRIVKVEDDGKDETVKTEPSTSENRI